MRLFLVNLSAEDLLALADLPEAQDSLLFNIGATDDRLRVSDCRPNLLHSAASRAMLADALAQYLAWKRWNRWFLTVGPTPADRAMADAYRRAAKRFGSKIVVEKPWTFEAGATRTDSGHFNEQQEANAFTQVGDYDALVVADEQDSFGEYLVYRTYLPRPVVGTQGLVATPWSGVMEQWGATQFQRRFREETGRFMTPLDYAAWLAVRSVGEGATRLGSADPKRLRDYSDRTGLQARGIQRRARFLPRLEWPDPRAHFAGVAAAPGLGVPTGGLSASDIDVGHSGLRSSGVPVSKALSALRFGSRDRLGSESPLDPTGGQMLFHSIRRTLPSCLAIAWLAASAQAQAYTVYVSSEQDNTVTAVDGETLATKATVKVGARPRGIALSKDNRSLYVCTSDADHIEVLDLDTLKVDHSLPSGPDPELLALGPEGRFLYVANEDDNMVTIVDVDARTKVAEIQVGVEPEGMGISPDGKWLVNTSDTHHMAHFIDLGTREVVANVLVDQRPRVAQFTPDGKQVWVSSEIGGTVSVIDTATKEKIKVIGFEIPGLRKESIQPVGIRISPGRQACLRRAGSGGAGRRDRCRHLRRGEVPPGRSARMEPGIFSGWLPAVHDQRGQ